MRICRIIDTFLTGKDIIGDLAPNYYYLSKLTAERGFDLHIICAKRDGQKEYEEWDNFRIHRVAPITRYMDILRGDFAKKVYEKVKELKPDLIHGHQNFHFGCLGRKSRINAPIITHYHGILDAHKFSDFLPFSYNLKQAIYDRLIARYYFYERKHVFKRSDYIISVSKAGEQSIKKYIPGAKISVIYNGVDSSVFHKVESDVKDSLGTEHLILYVGRAVPWKGIQYLLEAAKSLKDDFDFKILLLGVIRSDYPDIYTKWLMKIAEEYDLNNVIFSRQVPYLDMPKYYSSADVFALPSCPDASPKAVYEALACGTPIVATNGGGIPELVEGTKNEEFLINPKDASDLTDKIKYVLKNVSESDVKVFEWEKSVGEIVRLYEDILEETANPDNATSGDEK
jgi:glycosyltransferase involved in cell wall biosynthesis